MNRVENKTLKIENKTKDAPVGVFAVHVIVCSEANRSARACNICRSGVADYAIGSTTKNPARRCTCQRAEHKKVDECCQYNAGQT